jgi:Flp pilus assembly CpaE family ATPase
VTGDPKAHNRVAPVASRRTLIIGGVILAAVAIVVAVLAFLGALGGAGGSTVAREVSVQQLREFAGSRGDAV